MNEIKDIYIGMYLAGIGMFLDLIRMIYLITFGGGILVSAIIFCLFSFVFSSLLKKKKMKEAKLG